MLAIEIANDVITPRAALNELRGKHQRAWGYSRCFEAPSFGNHASQEYGRDIGVEVLFSNRFQELVDNFRRGNCRNVNEINLPVELVPRIVVDVDNRRAVKKFGVLAVEFAEGLEIGSIARNNQVVCWLLEFSLDVCWRERTDGGRQVDDQVIALNVIVKIT